MSFLLPFNLTGECLSILTSFFFVDHADWQGLLSAIKATGCENVTTTHGYTDLFAQYLREQGWNARTEKTQYDAETLETAATE